MSEEKSLQQVKLFNTWTREVELLTPIVPGRISIYCCGPTVYNYQHIGNLRTYIFEDLLVRTLRFAGYQVQHVMNITDVGHLVSDADEGEDKMALAAKREGRKSSEIAEFYTKIFFDHCAMLNINRPDVVCKATEHIPQMIKLIERLIANGAAYLSGGNVYFDVAKFKDYGKLAKLDLEALKAGARIEVDSNKRHPLDFALWFTKSKFENQELQWDSPWGTGYPGWHIECSAMSMNYLGEHFDIHCGGIDHIPVHHTNEIAQSEAATGKRFANVWMHGGFLLAEKEKMSKSTGEFLTLDKITGRGFDPMSYRLLCLGGSYRQELSWSWQALEASSNSLKKIRTSVLGFRKESSSHSASQGEGISELKAEFADAILNDLGMARALAVLHKVLSVTGVPAADKLKLLFGFDQVLGLGIQAWQESESEVPQEIKVLMEEREKARKNRDFKAADNIRDRILSLGYIVDDSKDGTRVRPKN